MQERSINHVGFLVDSSASMSHIQEKVRKQIETLKFGIQQSTPPNQKVLFSFFTFSDPRMFRRIVTDQPIEMVNERHLSQNYFATGPSTALVDATFEAVNHMDPWRSKQADESFLLYIITDGQENSSSQDRKSKISGFLSNLGDRWTVGLMVPDRNSEQSAIRYGFLQGNIEIWNPQDEKGIEHASRSIQNTYATYTAQKSAGVLRSSNLFRPDIHDLSAREVRDHADEFDGKIFPVRADSQISKFVESATGRPYIKGCCYYELSKPELVQGYKKIAIRSKSTDKIFSGPKARSLVGLSNQDQRIAPGDHGNWRIFVQSTSLNRKLLKGTSVLIEGV